jgi:twitching motility two-component system response regulator PilH
MTIKKILIVDDSATERHVLNSLLTKAGYEVVSCDSGDDAIVKARLTMPDLILMDVVMPGLNGFQATRAISRDAATEAHPDRALHVEEPGDRTRSGACARARATTS